MSESYPVGLDDEELEEYDDSKPEKKGFLGAFHIKPKKSKNDLKESIRREIADLAKVVALAEEIQSPNANKIRAFFDKLQLECAAATVQKSPESAKDLQHLLEQCRKTTEGATHEAKNSPLKVKVGKPAVDVTVYWTDIPGFADMSSKDRQQAAQKVAEKVSRGNGLVNAITQKNPFVPLPQERNEKLRAVTDIAWALKSRAQEKAGPYEKGGLTTPGGDELRKFFDSCGDDIYPRRSTHLGDQQRKPGQSPRGMDFYDGMDTLQGNGAGDGLLPMGMNTILMQMVEDTKGNKRMYLKMETASAYGSAGEKNKSDEQGIPGGGRTEKVDVAELLSHGMNIFRDTDQHKDLKARRETTPKGVYDACKQLIKQFENKTARAELKSALGKDKEKLRVNAFVALLQQWAGALKLNDRTQAAVTMFMNQLEDLYGADADLSVIAGGEVAL